LDGRKCNAPAVADVHVWLLLFANDLVLTLESEVGGGIVAIVKRTLAVLC
jgi:hypothetical protein